MPESDFVPQRLPDSAQALVSGECWNKVQRRAYLRGKEDTAAHLVKWLRSPERSVQDAFGFTVSEVPVHQALELIADAIERDAHVS